MITINSSSHVAVLQHGEVVERHRGRRPPAVVRVWHETFVHAAVFPIQSVFVSIELPGESIWWMRGRNISSVAGLLYNHLPYSLIISLYKNGKMYFNRLLIQLWSCTLYRGRKYGGGGGEGARRGRLPYSALLR